MVIHDGNKYYLQSTGFYYSTRLPVVGERLLHRVVWAQHNGPIPDGFDVHHVNGDWEDTRIENLELRKSGEHSREHILKSWSDPEIAAKFRAGLEKAQYAARAWHSSPEGREWHSKNAKAAMEKRLSDKVKAVCLECGCEFECFSWKKRKWCKDSCYWTFSNRKRSAAKKAAKQHSGTPRI